MILSGQQSGDSNLPPNHDMKIEVAIIQALMLVRYVVGDVVERP
jgi:hypothetical protein